MAMIKEIRKQATTPQFKVGDKVVFHMNIPGDRGGMSTWQQLYCVVKKVNRVTAYIATKNEGQIFQVSIDELKHYVDPYEGWA